MRAVDIVFKKRDKQQLTKEEIDFVINGYVNGEIPDYQISSLLMAIFFNGLTPNETATLTETMVNSGKTLNLSSVNGIKIDKHSTGGVGDKLSLLIAPLVASCGLKIPMMCGRGLGHTGGTLDKLESIDGYNIFLTENKVIEILNSCGFVFMGQTGDIVPADKKLYALRDVTATVESIPLITASILSKKIAEGANYLVMDIKCGNGAFMKDLDSAKLLSHSIVNTANKLNKKVTSVISNMDEPLGYTIGNMCEVNECIDILKNCKLDNNGNISEDFTLSKDAILVTLRLSTEMVILSGIESSYQKAQKMITDALNSGRAYELFLQNIALQGGKVGSLKENGTKFVKNIFAKEDGFISEINAYSFGIASMLLGCGRKKVEDSVDHKAGIIFNKKSGMSVKEGDIIATLHYNNCEDIGSVEKLCWDAIKITKEKTTSKPLFYQ